MKNALVRVGGWAPFLVLVAVAGCGGPSGGGGDAAARVDSGADASELVDVGAPDDATVDASSADDAAVDATQGEDAGGARICGTRGAGPCPTNQFCQHDIGADCGRGDLPGTCQTPPLSCTPGGATVCGCDGVTYANECEAHMASSGVDHAGPCATGPVSCDPHVLCRSLPPDCTAGWVPSVSADGFCWTGDCVPIDSCVCAAADECPDPSMYTCHLSAGHCGPFV